MANDLQEEEAAKRRQNLNRVTIIALIVCVVLLGAVLIVLSLKLTSVDSTNGIRIDSLILGTFGSVLLGAAIYQILDYLALRHIGREELNDRILSIAEKFGEVQLGKIKVVLNDLSSQDVGAKIIVPGMGRPKYANLAKEESEYLDIITTWFESYDNLVEYINDFLSINQGAKVRILLLNPRSVFTRYRCMETGDDEFEGVNQIHNSVKRITEFIDEHNYGNEVEVRLYDSRPSFEFWKIKDHVILSVFVRKRNKFICFDLSSSNLGHQLSEFERLNTLLTEHFNDLWVSSNTNREAGSIFNEPGLVRKSNGIAGNLFEKIGDIKSAINREIELSKDDVPALVHWIGTTMDDAWDHILSDVIKEARARSGAQLRLKIAMLDPGWTGIGDLNKKWIDKAGEYFKKINDEATLSQTDESQVDIDLFGYRYLPNYSGCLIGSHTLVITHVDWHEGNLSASNQRYKVYHISQDEQAVNSADDIAKEKIEKYLGWFKFYERRHIQGEE